NFFLNRHSRGPATAGPARRLAARLDQLQQCAQDFVALDRLPAREGVGVGSLDDLLQRRRRDTRHIGAVRWRGKWRAEAAVRPDRILPPITRSSAAVTISLEADESAGRTAATG